MKATRNNISVMIIADLLICAVACYYVLINDINTVLICSAIMATSIFIYIVNAFFVEAVYDWERQKKFYYFLISGIILICILFGAALLLTNTTEALKEEHSASIQTVLNTYDLELINYASTSGSSDFVTVNTKDGSGNLITVYIQEDTNAVYTKDNDSYFLMEASE